MLLVGPNIAANTSPHYGTGEEPASTHDSVHCSEIYVLGIQKALDSSGQKVSWQDEGDPAKKHEM